MFVKQFYLGCLAHASYLIGSAGEAAVIDPQRDVEQYIEEAEANGLKIKYVVETHLHADFVSGHTELAQRTGAKIIFGRRAQAAFEHIAASENDEFSVGTIKLSIIETPGHTPESICILASDETAKETPSKLFTGDTLFIGDVGRPDLVATKGFGAKEMAGMMYDSLHTKLLKLPDETEVYPAHGAGSLCGKQLSTERSSTIGAQKKFNYALKPMSKEEFIAILTSDQPEVPQYFTKDVQINWQGPGALASIERPKALETSQVIDAQKNGALVLDVRSGSEYAKGHIKNSLNIGLSGQFASWAGSFVPIGTPIILITENPSQIDETVTRLARVGIETVVGYLSGGISGWRNELVETKVLTVQKLKSQIESSEKPFLLDVRRHGEYEIGHAPTAINIPLGELHARFRELPENVPIAIICASGYRSSLATSVLEQLGDYQPLNVAGGTTAWREAGYEIEMTQVISV